MLSNLACARFASTTPSPLSQGSAAAGSSRYRRMVVMSMAGGQGTGVSCVSESPGLSRRWFLYASRRIYPGGGFYMRAAGFIPAVVYGKGLGIGISRHYLVRQGDGTQIPTRWRLSCISASHSSNSSPASAHAPADCRMPSPGGSARATMIETSSPSGSPDSLSNSIVFP